MKRLVILCAGVLCLVPVTAAGQATGPSLFGYGTLGSTALTAADSFEAVAGTSRRTNLGGGAHATIWRGLFVDAAVSRLRLTGERVFMQWLQLGGELRYRAVTGLLGEGGVSGVFGDDSIGGVAASVRVSVGR